ncbi:MAG: DUF5134 domain-containing protein [Mycobacteriaceae bacterium]|nr:DUF5134 domain-containing protein [Mycobacteriaceae bacterium]
MMGEFTLRWIVTALFGVSIATYLYILFAQRSRWTANVNHLLHLAMSVAMISMAWGIAMRLPAAEPIIFFLLAGVWFAGAACRPTNPASDRLANGYSAVMMAAMAWMFSAMTRRPLSPLSHSSDHGQPVGGVIDMSAMEMPPADPTTEWVTAANAVVVIGFAVAALYWACRYLAKRPPRTAPQTARLANLEPLYQACSAAGTALMFTALL